MALRVDGAKIREKRVCKGYSQRRFAEMVAISTSQMSQIELGDRGASPECLKRIADALDVEVRELLLTTNDNTVDVA